MTKEKIERKAKEIANQWLEPSDYNIARDAASEMAEWLLSHQWVSVQDELPPKKKRYSGYVIMRNRVGGHYIGCYDFLDEMWLDGHLEIVPMDITHWMPIPPLAEKGGKK